MTFGQPFKLIYKRTIRVYISIVIPLVFLFLIFEQYATLSDPILYFLPYCITLNTTALILGLWFWTCLEIRHLSNQLAQKLVEVSPCLPGSLSVSASWQQAIIMDSKSLRKDLLYML